jgi:pimeloyl-ACP methyl ester carboxylesterase
MIMKCKSGRGSRVCARAGIARRSFLRLSGAAVAGGLADVPRAAAEEGKGRPTFVMIHGAWHGAWAFEWVANLPTNSGFRVFAQDLPGFGLNAEFPSSYSAGNLDPNEVSPLAGITLDDYTESVVQLILSLQGSGPVIVMGHSLGGIVVNEVGERLGPEVIKRLVYLTAFMTPAGKTANDIAGLAIANGSLVRPLLVGSSAVSGALRLNPNSTDPAYRAQTQATFYNDVPAERIPAISNLLTPDNPVLPLMVPTSITKYRWGKIPRTFIRCTLDQAIPLGVQNALIAAADAFTPGNPTQTHTLQSSHSAFFSMPQHLASVLVQIAESTV